MADEKMLNIESMPSIKLGFTQMGLDDVNHINKYIDDNMHRLNDLSYSLVGQIKQHEKSAQPEFNLEDEIPQRLSNFFVKLAQEYSAAHPLSETILDNIGHKEDFVVNRMWSVHSYAGDYNPLHDHGSHAYSAFSGFIHTKLPPELKKKSTLPVAASTTCRVAAPVARTCISTPGTCFPTTLAIAVLTTNGDMPGAIDVTL